MRLMIHPPLADGSLGGRARRVELWLFTLFLVVGTILVAWLERMTSGIAPLLDRSVRGGDRGSDGFGDDPASRTRPL